jgi:hypothetical protein
VAATQKTDRLPGKLVMRTLERPSPVSPIRVPQPTVGVGERADSAGCPASEQPLATIDDGV